MDHSLTLHYTPDQQDYASVLRIFNWRRTSTKVILVLLALAFGAVVVTILSKGMPLSGFKLIWLLLPPLFVVYTFYLQPLRIAGRAVQNEQLAAETTWLVSDDGVKISSRFGSTRLDWSSIKTLVVTRDYYLLLSKENSNAFRFLPRRALTSSQDDALFLQIVTRNISKR